MEAGSQPHCTPRVIVAVLRLESQRSLTFKTPDLLGDANGQT